MGQEIVTGTGLSSWLSGWLKRIESEQPGAQLSISSKLKDEAQAALAAIDEALKPAHDGLVMRWLSALGTLTATRPDEADAIGKARAYATMLEFPTSAFNRRSLDAAARKFKFFPSYSELCEHLEAETAEAKRIRHQLRRLIALPVEDCQPRGRWSDLSDEQRAEFSRLMGSFRGTRGPEISGVANETQERAT